MIIDGKTALQNFLDSSKIRRDDNSANVVNSNAMKGTQENFGLAELEPLRDQSVCFLETKVSDENALRVLVWY